MKRFFVCWAPWFSAALLVIGMATSSGCAVTGSENVKTSGIWTHFVIDHHPDDHVVAWGVLRVGGQMGTIITLTGGDRMECNGVELTEYVEPITNFHWLRGDVAKDTIGDYEFSFIRPDETVGTLVSTPALPFIIDTVPADTLNSGVQLTINWDDSEPGDYVNIFLTGSCVKDIMVYNIADNGSYTLPAVADFDPAHPSPCTVVAELRRWVQGQVNVAFQGGYTEAKRMDAITLNYQ